MSITIIIIKLALFVFLCLRKGVLEADEDIYITKIGDNYCILPVTNLPCVVLAPISDKCGWRLLYR